MATENAAQKIEADVVGTGNTEKKKVKSGSETKKAGLELCFRKFQRFQMPNVPRWWQLEIIQYCFTNTSVRARLEKHMGKSLVSLTDKMYVNELDERVRQVLEDNLNRRVAVRVLDEMERLKNLILVGKTPLEDCPPELQRHPVFVFWRLVNKEVEKESKKRADAYLRKLKIKRKTDQPPAENLEDDGTSQIKKMTMADVFKKFRMQLIKRQGQDVQNGFRCTNSEFESQRYETNDVKNLRKLKTVDELYGLADKIIGTRRLQQS